MILLREDKVQSENDCRDKMNINKIARHHDIFFPCFFEELFENLTFPRRAQVSIYLYYDNVVSVKVQLTSLLT